MIRWFFELAFYRFVLIFGPLYFKGVKEKVIISNI